MDMSGLIMNGHIAACLVAAEHHNWLGRLAGQSGCQQRRSPKVDLSSCRAGLDRWMLRFPWPARSCRKAFRDGILLGVR